MERMSRFDFEVFYKSGHTNPADGLSRMYESSEPTLAFMSAVTDWEVVKCAVVIADLAPDPDLMFKIVAESASDPWIQKKASQLMDEEEGYFTLHGLIVVPESMQTEVIKLHHDSPTAGHMGVKKTIDLIQRQFWWSKMAESVNHYIQRCDSCQRNKSLKTPPFGLLQPIQIPDTRW